MDCDQCGREIDNLPYTCKGCEQQFCVEHRLPEQHSCVALAADQASQELKREQEEGDAWFKDEFRLSNVESSDDSPESTRLEKEKSEVTTEDCVECGKTMREHKIAGCPHCSEPYCGEHAAAHRRTCDERDTEGVESSTTVAEHYQERTRQKQQERKTRGDEIEEERRERFSSPDVNPDGTLSEPEYEDDIQSISSTKNEQGKSGRSNRILWITLAVSLLVIFFAYQFVL